jgi:acetolactate synthase-1/3 small subunit
MHDEKTFTLSIFTENRMQLLNRILIIFTRRHLHIESINISESELSGIYRYTVIIKTTCELVNKIAAQVEKLVEVLKVFVYSEDEVVHQQLALYKLSPRALTNNLIVILGRHNAHILTIGTEFIVVEKSGYYEDALRLFKELQPIGVLEFVCSGRVVITKPMKEFSAYLRELDAA